MNKLDRAGNGYTKDEYEIAINGNVGKHLNVSEFPD